MHWVLAFMQCQIYCGISLISHPSKVMLQVILNHTCLPQNCIFRNKNHRNLEHGIIFRNTSANVAHIYEINPAARFYGKNHRAIYLTDFMQAENAVFANHARRLPVQSFHNSTGNFRGHISWDVSLNVWKRLLFTGDAFAGAWSIDTAILSLEHEILLQMVPWLRWSIWLADSQCSLWETSEKLLLVASCPLCTCRTLPRANLNILVFRTCPLRPKWLSKFWHKTLATLWKNWKGRISLLLFFHEWENPELLRGYPYFRNALLILMIFWNKYGTAIQENKQVLDHAGTQ